MLWMEKTLTSFAPNPPPPKYHFNKKDTESLGEEREDWGKGS